MIGEQLSYKSHQLRAHNLLVTDESMTGGQDPIAVRRVHLDGFFFLWLLFINLRAHSQHAALHELNRNEPSVYNLRVNTKLCGKLGTLINARHPWSMVDAVLLKGLSFGLGEHMGGLGSQKCTSPRNIVWIISAMVAEPGSPTQPSRQRFKATLL